MINRNKNFGLPEIHESSHVDPLAVVIGRVVVESDVLIAPGASIRADEGSPFFIGRGTNIQDLVVLHGLGKKYFEVDGVSWSIYIGSHCSIAHCACVHGPVVIGKKTFIGIRSTVWGSIIGRECNIGFHCLIRDVVIPSHRRVPDGSMILCQADADNLPTVSLKDFPHNRDVVDTNKQLRCLHKEVHSEEL